MDYLGKKTKIIKKEIKLKEEPKKQKLQEDPKKEEKNMTSLEGYKDKRILDLINISEFNSLIPLNPPSSNISLFEMKKLAEIYLKENKYVVEDILEYDDTNKDIQKNYLNLAIKALNENTKLETKNIIIEKIKKSGIILDKKVYEEEINNLKDENLKKNLDYIDYKSAIIDTLEYIKNNQTFNLNVARENLKIRNIFQFKHESVLGNNNYYFYGLAKQIQIKLDELLSRHSLYLYIIKKNLEFLKKDFSKLSQKEIYIFKYISFILTDLDSITVKSTAIEIKNYLEGKKIENINELSKAIKDRNNKELFESDPELKNKISYNINFDDDYIEYIINEENLIGRKKYINNLTRKYKANIFNEHIIEVIKNISLENFEHEIFKNILPERDYSFSFYEQTRDKIFEIVKKILKSKAAKDFFDGVYKNKYNKNNQIIEYHFDRDEILEEIFKRIEFYPIFDSKIKANTNPNDLSIIVNSIPGKFDPKDEINDFNKKILQIGRITIFIIHEIFGHFCRRYYSYITNGIIKMDTGEDNVYDTKPKGGLFVEKKFLGFKTISRLYLKDALFLLFDEKNLEKYPIIKKGINLSEADLKIIIKNNDTIFDFIKKDNEEESKKKDKEEESKKKDYEEESKKKDNEKENRKKDNEKESKKKVLITFENYYNFLNPLRPKFPSIISCGVRKGEKFIEL